LHINVSKCFSHGAVGCRCGKACDYHSTASEDIPDGTQCVATREALHQCQTTSSATKADNTEAVPRHSRPARRWSEDDGVAVECGGGGQFSAPPECMAVACHSWQCRFSGVWPKRGIGVSAYPFAFALPPMSPLDPKSSIGACKKVSQQPTRSQQVTEWRQDKCT